MVLVLGGPGFCCCVGGAEPCPPCAAGCAVVVVVLGVCFVVGTEKSGAVRWARDAEEAACCTFGRGGSVCECLW